MSLDVSENSIVNISVSNIRTRNLLNSESSDDISNFFITVTSCFTL